MFKSPQFEFCQESIGDDYFNISFIQKDFRIEINVDFDDNEVDFFLDRPSVGFNHSKVVQSLEEIKTLGEEFIHKAQILMAEDAKLPTIKKEDCELFLKTASLDGMAEGVIEYKGELFYISAITSAYHKDRSSEDREKKVWRHFYVYDLEKKELDQVVMRSLDWMRHINLTPLCKDWKSLALDVGEKSVHVNHFEGKYRVNFTPSSKPVMKLTLCYD